MSPTPAITVMKVRTIGTKRASTMARLPYFSKNSWVLSTYFFLKIFESSRWKIDGPAAAPMA